MENLLKPEANCRVQRLMNHVEECGFNGDYTLPEYCPDIACILKCTAAPRLQNRQLSGDKLLVDGMVNLRTIYLDEERRSVRSVEFTVPFTCSISGCAMCDNSMIDLDFETKYVNCRAVSPRRVEVYGALKIGVNICVNVNRQLPKAIPCEELCLHSETVSMSRMIGSAEKVVTISEVLEFPATLPAAEMLLGGTCYAVVKEWKVLAGKIIARGSVWIHQTYTADSESSTMYCLDYEVPFSQIVDITGAHEGHLCCGNAVLLMDTERCLVGPDGENTLLEFTAKLMLHLQVYDIEEKSIPLEAYHTKYPLKQERQEEKFWSFCGIRREESILPILVELNEGNLAELLDVWLQPQNTETVVEKETVTINGDICVAILGKKIDSEIVYQEQNVQYRLEFPCLGNEVIAKVTTTHVRYRTVDGKLEIQATVCVEMQEYQAFTHTILQDIRLDTEHPYAYSKAGAILYYAQPGERLWDIGCECHTSATLIRKENAAVPDVITTPCVLMIPIVS